jgi:hypothetical protein
MDTVAILKELFDEARSNGGLEYIFTLVRVDGMTFNVPDPILQLRTILQGINLEQSDEAILQSCCTLLELVEQPFSLIANLLNCVRKQPFNCFPFLHLRKGEFPHFTSPTPLLMKGELIKIATEAERPQITQLLNEVYPDELLGAVRSLSSEKIRGALEKLKAFLSTILEIYFAERLKYRDEPRFYKLPRFEVLELLVNDEYGLYGFQMYFSNGSSAKFKRYPDSTECVNVELDVPIGFWVGDLNELRHEWRVGEKRLYEVGLPGRYNKVGEWKPIIYPGDSSALQKDARALSKDPEVQGVLFYMMCTGHRVIEFVARTTIELPVEGFTTFSNKLHLWKCPDNKDVSPPNVNVRIYDGWLELESTDPEYIRSGIATIAIALNRMAFAYGAAIDWRIKYTTVIGTGSYATPSKEDLSHLDAMLRNFLKTEDAMILEAAIDWYNRGRTSRNIFNRFLCYYIALESISVAVADGEADFGLEYSRESKAERRHKRMDCVQEKYKALYSKNPLKFVEESYFDCIVGLKEKTRRVAEVVFGSGHEYLEILFKKSVDGYSLSDIRGRLAHGGVTLIDRQDESLVRNRLHEIEEITKDFLTRIIFLLKPADSLPSWSGRHAVYLSAADPRTTLVATKESIFPTTDWRIRPEWCD